MYFIDKICFSSILLNSFIKFEYAFKLQKQIAYLNVLLSTEHEFNTLFL